MVYLIILHFKIVMRLYIFKSAELPVELFNVKPLLIIC